MNEADLLMAVRRLIYDHERMILAGTVPNALPLAQKIIDLVWAVPPESTTLILDGTTDLTVRYAEPGYAPYPHKLGTVYIARAHLSPGDPPQEISVIVRLQ